MRVLVVEDDAKIASFVVRGLKQAGYAVDHAEDGETALALTQSTTYDAAIVDVMLPRLDGLSLVRRVRAARSALPVVFLSAKSAVDDRVRGLQAGGEGSGSPTGRRPESCGARAHCPCGDCGVNP